MDSSPRIRSVSNLVLIEYAEAGNASYLALPYRATNKDRLSSERIYKLD
jgi:hypothetical protein